MNVNFARSLATIVTILTIGSARPAQNSEKIPMPEQTLFGAEDNAMEKPVNLPKTVLQILAKDDLVIQYLKAEEKSPDELTTESFLASEIHLDGPNEIDLIATGIGRLRGNVATFWVFQPSPHGYKVTLRTVAQGLRVLDTRSKGYRDIQTGSPIAGSAHVAVYCFDRTRYRLCKTKSEPIP
jgi:hypothetical protein